VHSLDSHEIRAEPAVASTKRNRSDRRLACPFRQKLRSDDEILTESLCRRFAPWLRECRSCQTLRTDSRRPRRPRGSLRCGLGAESVP